MPLFLHGSSLPYPAASCSSFPATVLQEATFHPLDFFLRSHRTNGFTKQQQHRQDFLTSRAQEVCSAVLLSLWSRGCGYCQAAASAPVVVLFKHDNPVTQLHHPQLSNRSIKARNSVVCLQTPCFPDFPSEDKSDLEEVICGNLLVPFTLQFTAFPL